MCRKSKEIEIPVKSYITKDIGHGCLCLFTSSLLRNFLFNEWTYRYKSSDSTIVPTII